MQTITELATNPVLQLIVIFVAFADICFVERRWNVARLDYVLTVGVLANVVFMLLCVGSGRAPFVGVWWYDGANALVYASLYGLVAFRGSTSLKAFAFLGPNLVLAGIAIAASEAIPAQELKAGILVIYNLALVAFCIPTLLWLAIQGVRFEPPKPTSAA